MAVSRLPSLNALKAFESVARLGALNRAAEELNVTESAVSRQIRALEDDLRVELFRRVHRGVRLSPEGEQLAEMVLRRRKVLAAFLVDILKVNGAQAEIDVCKTEHLFSLETTQKLEEFVFKQKKVSEAA